MPIHGCRMLTVVLLTLAVCGCGLLDEGGPNQDQQDAAAAQQSCIAKGFAEGTPEFSNCIEAERILIADRRRRGLPQTEEQPQPTSGAPGSGRLCLPTASGQSTGC